MTRQFTDDERMCFIKALTFGWFWPLVFKYIFFSVTHLAGTLLILLAGDDVAPGASDLVSTLADLAGYAGYFWGTLVWATVFVALTWRAWVRVLSPGPSPRR
jgi:hypothetical protein